MRFCRTYLDLKRWPSALVFALAGSVATVFAFVTVNLFTYAMANASFIREHGVEALRHGAIWQIIELLGWGSLALACWIVFKLCEHVLVDRYLTWSRSDPACKSAPEADQAQHSK